MSSPADRSADRFADRFADRPVARSSDRSVNRFADIASNPGSFLVAGVRLPGTGGAGGACLGGYGRPPAGSGTHRRGRLYRPKAAPLSQLDGLPEIHR